MWLLITALVVISSTCGSPAAALSWLSASVPPPPGRLTTLTVTSTSLCFWNRRWSSRAVRSLVPPGALGAISVTARVGFHPSCAGAAPAVISEIARTALIIVLRVMRSLQAFVGGLYLIPAPPGLHGLESATDGEQ